MTTSTKTPTDPVCKVCNTPKSQHAGRQHQFNEDGQLIPLERQPARLSGGTTGPRGDAGQQAAIQVSRLVLLLQHKGLITQAELNWVIFGTSLQQPPQQEALFDPPDAASTG